MRALFPMYDTPFQFMVREGSGIRSVGELTGKRVGIGPQGGTSGAYIPEFFKVLKVDASLLMATGLTLANQVQAGTLDALAVAAGVPFPSFIDLERKGKVRYVPLTRNRSSIYASPCRNLELRWWDQGTYPSLRSNYETVGLYNFAVAQRDVPVDLAYAILDAVFANHDELVEVHSAAAETVPANFTRNTFLPFHDGASRWYQNKVLSASSEVIEQICGKLKVHYASCDTQIRVLSTNLTLLCPSRKRSRDGASSLLSDYYLVSQSNFCESSS